MRHFAFGMLLAVLGAPCAGLGGEARLLDRGVLGLIPSQEAIYAVSETYAKKGGVLAGEHTITLRLRLAIDAEELKKNPQKYEGTDVAPVLAITEALTHVAAKPGGERQTFTVPNSSWYDPWHRGLWDRAQHRFKFSHGYLGDAPTFMAMHLSTVCVPALAVQFPPQLRVEKGVSWGEEPKPMPQAIEHLSALQKWTVANVEETDAGPRLKLFAQCQGAPDEKGQRCSMKREAVYDTGRGLVVRSTVTFEREGGPEPERVQLVMQLQGEP